MIRAQLSDRQGVVDSSLPTVAFLLGYLVSGQRLGVALAAAIGAGVVVAVLRAVRRQPLRHIATGFIGVAFAAFIASRTGRAEDFFLPGLLLNGVYGAAFAISALVRRPLVGLGIGFMTNDGGSWAQDRDVRRAAYRATWLWAGAFGLRLLVQVPLYLAGAVGWLGTARLVLGFPLFALAVLATYRLLSGPLARRRAAQE
jgi:uncharacterized membrane protein YeaQ/YmgE (transglycosylase-associated protein family)